MKKQWSTMSETQLDNFSALKERLHLIGKNLQCLHVIAQLYC
jgi:hypothetical protein